jgi:hypothetical protein
MIGSLKQADPLAWHCQVHRAGRPFVIYWGSMSNDNALDQDEAEANDIAPVGRETLAAPENVFETIASDANDAEGSLVDRQAWYILRTYFTSEPVGSGRSMLGSATACRLNQDARRACSFAGSLM